MKIYEGRQNGDNLFKERLATFFLWAVNTSYLFPWKKRWVLEWKLRNEPVAGFIIDMQVSTCRGDIDQRSAFICLMDVSVDWCFSLWF